MTVEQCCSMDSVRLNTGTRTKAVCLQQFYLGDLLRVFISTDPLSKLTKDENTLGIHFRSVRLPCSVVISFSWVWLVGCVRVCVCTFMDSYSLYRRKREQYK